MVWLLLATLFFVLLNGFFVAAEFALVKVRGTRIEALAGKGNPRAQVTFRMLGHLDRYLSACQLGITMASLILGWLSEPAIARLLLSAAGSAGLEVHDSRIVHAVSLGLALAVVTVLHMTLGEQAPKVWAIQRAEAMALFVAYPLRAFSAAFRPFIWVINSISNGLLRLIGIPQVRKTEGVQDVEELRTTLRAASRAGHITGRQRAFGENILGLMNLQVRHMMVPRTDVVSLREASPLEENLRVIEETGHSRFPYGDPDLDNVVGLIHSKDVLGKLFRGEDLRLREILRPIPSVPDTQPVSRLILDLQRERTHCALVVDEHGTTVGVAFLEDALEEIVGPIHDEFDQGLPWISRPAPDVLEMAGTVPLPEAAEVLDMDLGREEDTIGGYVVSILRRLPSEGDQVEMPPYRATVISMSRRRVARVRIERLSPPPPPH